MKARAIILFLLSLFFSAVCQASVLTASVAASLKDAFTAMAQAFHQTYPQATVQLNFAASGVLLQQMRRGAPVDLFVSADQQTMQQAALLMDATTIRDFASNRLVWITAVNRALHLKDAFDVLQPQIHRIAAGDAALTPHGRYAKMAFEAHHVWQGIVPKLVDTQNVRQTLSYVANGDVDVGVVFQTDARLLPNKVKVLVTLPTVTPIGYWIGVTKRATDKKQAQQFVDFVLSATGQHILKKYGFLAVSS